jgi:putative cofactor-binding repeat protein
VAAGADAYAWLGNSKIVVPAANGVLGNDTLATGGVVAIQTSSVRGGTVNITADGGFTYEPPVNVTGIDTFTYTATGAAGATATGTVTITIGAVVRYVKNDFVGTSNGSSTAPFTTLTAAAAVAGPGDIIFVFSGNGTTTGQNGTVLLRPDQRLLGQGVGLIFDVLPANATNPLLPITGVAATTALPLTPPVLTHTAVFAGNVPVLTLANNVEVAGFIIDGTGTTSSLLGMAGAAVTGFNIHDNTIRNLPRAAIQFSGATVGTGMIVNNTFTNILGVNPDNAIDIVTTAAGVNFTLTGNILNNVLETGIRIQFPGGGVVAVSNNTLTNIGTNANRRGIDVAGAGTATISGNTVDNTGVAAISRSGIQVNATGNLKASVTGNIIRNAAPADGGIQAQTTIFSDTLCLRMTGNTTANNFILDNIATNTAASFQIEGPLPADFVAANTNTGIFTYRPNVATVSFVPVGTCFTP